MLHLTVRSVAFLWRD